MSYDNALREKEKRRILREIEREKKRRQGVINAQNPAEWIRSLTIENPQNSNDKKESPKSNIIKFELWPEQEDTLDKMHNNPQVIILKSRQLGISWLVQAYALWLCAFFENVSIIIISKDFTAAKEVVRRIKGMYERLPEKPVEKGDVWNVREISFANNSRIKAFAPTKTSGASFTGTLVIADEFALTKFADVLFATIKPTIDDGGKIVILSTADDSTGQTFEDLYRGALNKENDFIPVFLPWWVRPERTRDWYDKKYNEAPNKKAFKQQYPSTVEEAFAIIGERQYIEEEDWGDCYDENLVGDITEGETKRKCQYVRWISSRFDPDKPIVWGLDGSIVNDTTVLTGVGLHPDDPEKYAVLYMTIFKPTREHPIDFDGLRDEILTAWKSAKSQVMVYDPTQLVEMCQKLDSYGIITEEFVQQGKRWESDTLLRTLIQSRKFSHGNFEELTEHIENANAKVDADERSRIIKKKKVLKIDAAVSLSMAIHKLVEIAHKLNKNMNVKMDIAQYGNRGFGDAYSMGVITVDPASGLHFSTMPRTIGYGQ